MAVIVSYHVYSRALHAHSDDMYGTHSIPEHDSSSSDLSTASSNGSNSSRENDEGHDQYQQGGDLQADKPHTESTADSNPESSQKGGSQLTQDQRIKLLETELAFSSFEEDTPQGNKIQSNHVSNRHSGGVARQRYEEFTAWQSEINRKFFEKKRLEEQEHEATMAPKEKTFTQAELDNAHNQGIQEGKRQGHAEGVRSGHEAGYKEGVERGKADAQSGISAQLVKVTQELQGMLQKLEQRQQHMRQQCETASSALALKMIQHLWPSLDYQTVATEVENMMVYLAKSVVPQGTVKVWLHPEVSARLHDSLNVQAQSAGLERHVMVLSEAGMRLGDVRFEWDGGVLERNTEDMAAQLQALVIKNTDFSEEHFSDKSDDSSDENDHHHHDHDHDDFGVVRKNGSGAIHPDSSEG